MSELIQTYLPNVYRIGWTGDTGWGMSIYNTLYMTFVPFIYGGLAGLIGGLLIVMTAPGGVIENKFIYWILDKVASVFRALPFIILLAVLAPFTRLIVGTSLGATAANVSLSVSVFAFFFRQVQVVLSEMDKGVIEAAQASGATTWDIVGVYLTESLPDLIRVSTLTLVSLVGYTTMAGAIGAGGLGTTAIAYGYQRFNQDVTWTATILILLLIFLIQFIGDTLTNKISHR